MTPGNATARFLDAPDDRKAIRVELWEADFLRPTPFSQASTTNPRNRHDGARRRRTRRIGGACLRCQFEGKAL